MPIPLIAAGVLAGVAAVGSIIRAKNANKFQDVEKRAYKFQEHGSPGIAGLVSGATAGFNQDPIDYTVREPVKKNQRWETIGAITQAVGSVGSSIAGSFAGGGPAFSGVQNINMSNSGPRATGAVSAFSDSTVA